MSRVATSDKLDLPPPSARNWKLGMLLGSLCLLYTVILWDFDTEVSQAIQATQQPSGHLTGYWGALIAFKACQLFGYGSYALSFLGFWLTATLLSKNSWRARWFTPLPLFLWLMAFCGIWTLYDVLEVGRQSEASAVEIVSKNLPEGKTLKHGFSSGRGGLLGRAVCGTWILAGLGTLGFALTSALTWLLLSLYLFGENLLALARFLASPLTALARFLALLGTFPATLTKLVKWLIQSRKKTQVPRREPPAKQPSFRAKPVKKKTKKKPSARKTASGLATPLRKDGYTFPHLQLLDEQLPNEGGKENQEERAAQLMETLGEFGVEVSLAEILSGPVITRYEVIPAPGVRLEKILSLDKNIALALRARAVRVLAPVPGKGTVGVEVPKQHPETVYLRTVLESEHWLDFQGEIPIILGKDVTGKAIVEDLTRMPHMLIAGATGAGKTVCINAIITSLLYRASPEDVRFLMVDPKLVEMQIYKDLPHLLIPLVTDPKKVPAALRYLLHEMETRYRIFAKARVRNIGGFNRRVATTRKERELAKLAQEELEADMSEAERAAPARLSDETDIELPNEKLPYIVCVMDEIADLMMVAPQEVETSIARLTQLARAAGIHLILATQRPSVNVITGLIKANLPTRISFMVASKIDSRTILDAPGADALIGRGDMLYIPPGSSELVRAQGAFVSDNEVTAVMDFIRDNNATVEFVEEAQSQIEEAEEENEEDWEDKMTQQALKVIRASGRTSISFLQRKLKIGYNRAARILEELQARGLVSPGDETTPED